MERKQKRTTSISTDGGYRLVAQLNRKRTATGTKKKNSTLSLEKTKDLCKALMQIFKKQKKIIIQPYNNRENKIKKIKNNNWAPSKIRLRLGAEVDKNYNNSNHNKNTIFLIQSNSTGTCAVTTMEERSSTDKPGKDDERKKLRYTKSLVMLGPTGRLVLSANIKKYNVLVLCYSNSF